MDDINNSVFFPKNNQNEILNGQHIFFSLFVCDCVCYIELLLWWISIFVWFSITVNIIEREKRRRSNRNYRNDSLEIWMSIEKERKKNRNKIIIWQWYAWFNCRAFVVVVKFFFSYLYWTMNFCYAIEIAIAVQLSLENYQIDKQFSLFFSHSTSYVNLDRIENKWKQQEHRCRSLHEKKK